MKFSAELYLTLVLFTACGGQENQKILINKDSVSTVDIPLKPAPESQTFNTTFYIHSGKDSIRIGQVSDVCKSEPIVFNEQLVFCDSSNGFVYDSKWNRVIDENGKIILFVETMGMPNFNHIVAYEITSTSGKIVADVAFNNDFPQFSDIDNDGFLEFGGKDLHEVPPWPGYFAYYTPHEYYEIRDGAVSLDKVLTKKLNTEEYGFYWDGKENNSHFIDFKGWGPVVRLAIPSCGNEKAIAIGYDLEEGKQIYIEKTFVEYTGETFEVIHFPRDSMDNRSWYCKKTKTRM